MLSGARGRARASPAAARAARAELVGARVGRAGATGLLGAMADSLPLTNTLAGRRAAARQQQREGTRQCMRGLVRGCAVVGGIVLCAALLAAALMALVNVASGGSARSVQSISSVRDLQEVLAEDTRVVAGMAERLFDTSLLGLPGGTTSEEDGAVIAAKLHFVFSTDCRLFQHWQSVALIGSARLVGQRGHFTRIVSDCPDEAAKQRVLIINQPRDGLTTVFAPKLRDSYPQQNRPDGLTHWLQNADPPIQDDVILVVLDPDQMFMKPLTQIEALERPATLKHWSEDRTVAVPGKPVGQGYGIGGFAKYVSICEELWGKDASEGCQAAVRREAEENEYMVRHYSVGAPYMMAAGDMGKLAPLWSTLTPLVHAREPSIMADMWAYSMAAAHLGLEHDRVENLAISDPLGVPRNARAGGSFKGSIEGWQWIDDAYLDESAPLGAQHPCRCHTPVHSTDPSAELPTLMHYCATYKIFHDGPDKPFTFGTSKYRMPDDRILDCAHPLLAEPWAPSPPGVDILAYNTADRWAKYMHPGFPHVDRMPREAFSACQVVLMWNMAFTDHKRTFCPDGFNANKTYYLMAL